MIKNTPCLNSISSRITILVSGILKLFIYQYFTHTEFTFLLLPILFLQKKLSHQPIIVNFDNRIPKT